MEIGLARREDLVQSGAVHRRFDTEVCERGNLRFAYGQVNNAGVHGEGGDRLEIGGFDVTVVADGILRTGVAAMTVAVSGVVLGDAVHEGQHGPHSSAQSRGHTEEIPVNRVNYPAPESGSVLPLNGVWLIP